MERLTEQIRIEYEDKWITAEAFETDDVIRGKAIDRLAEYEDIGLTPEEIKFLLHDGGISIAMRSREAQKENTQLKTELEQEQKARQQAEADNAALREALLKLLQAIDYYKTTRSPDMGGKHGIVIRVPQGKKGEQWHTAYSSAIFALDKNSSGSALSEELEQYREALENIIHALESPHPNMDIAAKKIAEEALKSGDTP